MVHQTTALALMAGLTSLASGTPLKQPKIGIFTVSQVANINFRPHGPAQMAKTLAKYGVTLPDGLVRTLADLDALRLSSRASGSATAAPELYDIEYLTPVHIGTPAQTLNVDIDTGSSDLWVFSTDTPPGSVHGQARYNPKSSKTSKKLKGESWSITYGDASSSSGIVYQDTVSLGGITVQGQAVEAATQVSPQFTRDANNDGLLGLGFSIINSVQPTPQLTWFDNAAKSLNSKLFTADLKYHKTGSYEFGRIDNSKHTGDIAYTDVDPSQGFWMFEASGYAVGNGTFQSAPFKAIADTGTTLAMLPSKAVSAYYKAINGAKMDMLQGGWTFPCNSAMPDFVLGAGKARIVIPARFIKYAPADQTGRTCFGGIQPDDGIGFSILGDVALKAAFVVFDAAGATPRLGWANKRL